MKSAPLFFAGICDQGGASFKALEGPRDKLFGKHNFRGEWMRSVVGVWWAYSRPKPCSRYADGTALRVEHRDEASRFLEDFTGRQGDGHAALVYLGIHSKPALPGGRLGEGQPLAKGAGRG